jgi:hypothetical protein
MDTLVGLQPMNQELRKTLQQPGHHKTFISVKVSLNINQSLFEIAISETLTLALYWYHRYVFINKRKLTSHSKYFLDE